MFMQDNDRNNYKKINGRYDIKLNNIIKTLLIVCLIFTLLYLFIYIFAVLMQNLLLEIYFSSRSNDNKVFIIPLIQTENFIVIFISILFSIIFLSRKNIPLLYHSVKDSFRRRKRIRDFGNILAAGGCTVGSSATLAACNRRYRAEKLSCVCACLYRILACRSDKVQLFSVVYRKYRYHVGVLVLDRVAQRAS